MDNRTSKISKTGCGRNAAKSLKNKRNEDFAQASPFAKLENFDPSHARLIIKDARP